MNRLRAIFFDWDDTLCYVKPHRYDTFGAVLEKFGYNISDSALICAEAAIRSGAILPSEQYVEALCSQLRLPEPVLRATTQAFQERELVKETLLFEDAIPVIQSLRSRGLRLAVVSNNSEQRLAELARQFALTPYLELIVSSEIVGVGKPDGRIFQYALDQLGISADCVLHLGDSYEADVIGARAVGIAPVLIDRRHCYSEVDCPHLDNLADLIPLMMERFDLD
ncbi:MAG: HAD-IA family hydrolase [Chloroflexi bacterium]|nr:HAD-IA family hydrolase [Chloroflexota bacterium]MCL5074682.1 HAD-IA family hydrolase [Chloroflexota bacterium]